MNQATGKIESLFTAHNSGVDEGQPKKNAEFIVLGTNVIGDNTAVPQKISVDIDGVTKSLYVYPGRTNLDWQLGLI